MKKPIELSAEDWEVLESAINSAEEALMTDADRCRYEALAQPYRRDLEALRDLWERMQESREEAV